MLKNNDLIINNLEKAEQVFFKHYHNPASHRKAALLVSLVLVIVMAKVGAELVWQFLEPATPVLSPASLSSTKSSSPQKEVANLQPLINAHIFGRASSQPVAVKQAIVAPPTRLQLDLLGIIDTGNDSAMAIIAERNKQEKTYLKGDNLPGNAKLHEIYQDRVILSRGGQLETLTLNRETVELEITPAEPGMPVRTNGNHSKDINSLSPGTSPTTQKTKQAENPQLSKQAITQNPGLLLRDMSFIPVMKGNQLEGYQLQHQQQAFLSSLGLKPEDIITSVNGTSVEDMRGMMLQLQQSRSLKELKLDIVRQGQAQSLSISLQ